MGRCPYAGAALVIALAAGCGSSPAGVPDAPPQAVPSDKPRGAGESAREKPAESAALRRYENWFRSDYVKNLNPKPLKRMHGNFAHSSMVSLTFEEATDKSDLVVFGRVTELIFIPTATITKFAIDRSAKGNSETSEIYFLQTNHVTARKDDFTRRGNAVLVADLVQPPVFKGDRAVMFLEDITGAVGPQRQKFIDEILGSSTRIYMVARGAGQYRIQNGKIRAENPSELMPTPENRFAGKAEGEILSAAEGRVRAQAHESPSP